MKSIYRHKFFIGVFFATLFITHYSSITLFSHIHIINGATITHSHIHADSHHNTKSGGHTKGSLTLIAQAEHCDYFATACQSVPTPVQFYTHQDILVENGHWINSLHLENLSLRAPPAV